MSTYPHTAYDLSKLLTSLGTGEAVVTVLSEQGAPTPVAWTRMIAPQSLMAPSDPARVEELIAASSLAARYAAVADRESATSCCRPGSRRRRRRTPGRLPLPPPGPEPAPSREPARRQPKEAPTVVEQVVQSSAFKSMLRSAGTVIGREITRSIFGTARRRR